MATIDLGKIKLVWRGTYNNGTAYTVDDVVEYTDSGVLSSYICVANSTGNAPSSSGTAHASWNYLVKGAAAETNASIRTKVEAASDSNVFTDADHTKLNGIETSATADQTGAEIASALNGQDIFTTGIIGRDSTDYIHFGDNTKLDITINSSNEFRFEADGDFHADGDVYAFSTTISSDERLKENIEIVPNALEKLESLNGVTFDWKRDGTSSAGVIAQNVQKVLPQAVKEVKGLKDNQPYLTVNYHALTSILIEAIKELKTEIDELKGGNNAIN